MGEHTYTKNKHTHKYVPHVFQAFPIEVYEAKEAAKCWKETQEILQETRIL